MATEVGSTWLHENSEKNYFTYVPNNLTKLASRKIPFLWTFIYLNILPDPLIFFFIMKPDYWIFVLTLFFVCLFHFQKSCKSKESRCREWRSNSKGESSQSSGDGELDMCQIIICSGTRFEFRHEMCFAPIWGSSLYPYLHLWPSWPFCTARAEVCLRRALASE